MLIQQQQDTQGAASDTISIVSGTVDRERFEDECFAGIQLQSTGQRADYEADGSVTDVLGQWMVSGTASDFYVQCTVTSGSLDGSSSAAGSFLQLNADRDFFILRTAVGINQATIFIEISSDASGVPVVDDATITLLAIHDTLD